MSNSTVAVKGRAGRPIVAGSKMNAARRLIQSNPSLTRSEVISRLVNDLHIKKTVAGTYYHNLTKEAKAASPQSVVQPTNQV